MTAHNGRGQGEDLPYEGVVLPANGEPWGPEQQRETEHRSQPAAGTPWGEPWGPESTSPPPTTPPAPPPAGLPVTPPEPQLPPEGAVPPAPLAPPTVSPEAQTPPAPSVPPVPNVPPVPSASPASPETAVPPMPPQAPPAAGPPSAPPSIGGGPLPPEQGAQGRGAQGTGDGWPQSSAETAALSATPSAGALPPPPSGQPDAPYHGGESVGPAGAWPSHEDASATQALPAQGAVPPLPPEDQGGAVGPDAEATQHMPLYAGTGTGAGTGTDAESTQQMPFQSAAPPAAGPPPASAPYGIRPGTPEERKPLPEFDSLFRAESGADEGQQATQNLPPVDPGGDRRQPVGGRRSGSGSGSASAAAATDPGAPQGRAARRMADRERGRQGMSPTVLVGVGIAAVAIVGLIAGAALSAGGDEAPRADGSTGPVGAESSPPADSGKAQAKKLSSLLKESNNSRTSVIQAVGDIRACEKLGQAAEDLRAAARQRTRLVEQLDKLELDALPSGKALSSALEKAWKASAEADRAYAAWANQVAGKNGCPKGKARSTQKTAAGSRASGKATAAKKKAASLWNPIARNHGLPERKVSQL